MLRPEMVIEYAKARAQLRRSDFSQLMDGVNVGGRIIVCGPPEVSAKFNSTLTANRRLGTVVATSEIREVRLDPQVTYSFDTMAVAQMLMIAKNEAFHATVDQCISLLQDLCVTRQEKIEVGLQVLREHADQIGHL